MTAQPEFLDAVKVQLARFVIERGLTEAALACEGSKDGQRIVLRLGLGQHKLAKSFAREFPGPVEHGPIEVFVERQPALVEVTGDQIVPFGEFVGIQMELLDGEL